MRRDYTPAKRVRQGNLSRPGSSRSALGILALLLSLTTLITTTIQFILLWGLIYYRRHLPPSPAPAKPAPASQPAL